MAYRHKVQARASGGGCEPSNPPATEESRENTVKESRERKRGGKVVERKDGGEVTEKRKEGGAVDKIERKFGGMVAGAKAATRADRPGRKRGGGVGADTSPLSSNARSSPAKLAQQH